MIARLRPVPFDLGPVHFVGIGGIGMSGIAEIMLKIGYSVQGSDAKASANTERLEKLGARVFIGHDAANVSDGVSAVVYSTAVKATNPEMMVARDRRIPLVRRAEMLAELMRLQFSIAVGGTHGKTTTTSMVAAILDAGGLDPTVVNGGIINAYGTNAKVGDGDWIVVEADESDGSFLRLKSTVAIVTNIDPEHLDHYGDFDGVRKAFVDFVENIPFYGFAAVCLDHPEVQRLVASIDNRRLVTYGVNPRAMVRADNVEMKPDGCRFDVVIQGQDWRRWTNRCGSPACICPWPGGTMFPMRWRPSPWRASWTFRMRRSGRVWPGSAACGGASPPPASSAGCGSSTTTATIRSRSPPC